MECEILTIEPVKEQKVTQTVSRVVGSAAAQERYTSYITIKWSSLSILIAIRVYFVHVLQKMLILFMNFGVMTGSRECTTKMKMKPSSFLLTV